MMKNVYGLYLQVSFNLPRQSGGGDIATYAGARNHWTTTLSFRKI